MIENRGAHRYNQRAHIEAMFKKGEEFTISTKYKTQQAFPYCSKKINGQQDLLWAVDLY